MKNVNEEKKYYEDMKLEVILFDCPDVIITSNESDDWAEEDDNF